MGKKGKTWKRIIFFLLKIEITNPREREICWDRRQHYMGCQRYCKGDIPIGERKRGRVIYKRVEGGGGGGGGERGGGDIAPGLISIKNTPPSPPQTFTTAENT